jgi:inositol polyphosphate 1-phosphatase
MSGNIYGEESNVFTNNLGERVEVKIGETEELTKEMLGRVLGQNIRAAELLAKEVHHQEVSIDGCETDSLPDDLIASYSGLGIWIDPIGMNYEVLKL